MGNGQSASGVAVAAAAVGHTNTPPKWTTRECIEYIKTHRFPINVIVTAPPGFSVEELCMRLSDISPFVYLSHGYDSNAQASPYTDKEKLVDAQVRSTRIGEEQMEKQRACQRMICENEEQNSKRAREAVGSTQVMYEHLHRLLENYMMRHVMLMPPSDLVKLPPDADRRNYAGMLLWRIFRTSPFDLRKGQISMARHFGITSEEQTRQLLRMSTLAELVMQNDCSAATTVFVCVMPTEAAYTRIVQAASCQMAEEPRQRLVSDQMWYCYRQYKEAFEHDDEFIKNQWTMLFNVDCESMSEANMVCVGTELVDWITQRRRDKLWGAKESHRRAYLTLARAHVDRVVTVPRDGPTESSYGNRASASATISPVQSHVMPTTHVARRTSSSSAISHSIQEAHSEAVDAAIASGVMMDVMMPSEGFHRNQSKLRPSSNRRPVAEAANGWASHGAKLGNGD